MMVLTWLKLSEPFDEVNDLWPVVANDSPLVSFILVLSWVAIDLRILDASD